MGYVRGSFEQNAKHLEKLALGFRPLLGLPVRLFFLGDDITEGGLQPPISVTRSRLG